MGKSRAEIQKAYRERQKAKGSAFLEKERVRQLRYYKPAADLSAKKRAERNEKNKFRNRLSRLRKKQREQNDNVVTETSGYESAGDNNDVNMSTDEDANVSADYNQPGPSGLIVKLPIMSHSAKAKGLKKVRARALARANKKVRDLKHDIETLRKKIKVKDRKISRMVKRQRQIEAPQTEDLTPRKQTDQDINMLNLTPTRRRFVRRKLLHANTVMAEVKESRKATSRKKRNNLHRIISGTMARKYRCITNINKFTGLSRKSLVKVFDKDLVNYIPTEKRICKARNMRNRIIEFFMRDDNSRAQPGKADAKKVETGEKMQTRVLTDYIKNLYDKYLSENPDADISLSTFQRLRPKNILLTSFISRNTCQCIHHQNMALKVQALRKSGIKIGQNPESLIPNQHDLDEILKDLPANFEYKIWKKVEVEPGKMRMKVVDQQTDASTFRENLKKQMKDFTDHVNRVKEQYSQVRDLKANLPNDEMILQMDFAENFSCRSLNEIQTAYWNQSMVTLHPVVAYFKEGDILKHQSFVVVSDEMSHSASTVCAFIDKLMPCLKLLKPNMKTVHYWTDSPSSQYRNRYIFYTIANHQNIYQIRGRWNYFEAGHGKGPCDGLGGTVKRMADEAINQGHTTIQDAADFYKWGSTSTMTGVRFLYVPKSETQQKHEEMNNIVTKPLKGTMKLHAIGVEESHLMTRETSCYCNICIKGHYCRTWEKQNTIVANLTENETETNGNQETVYSPQQDAPEQRIDLELDEFVAVIYDRNWFIGQIVDKDPDEGDYEINFMAKAKQMYKWPTVEDRIWVDHNDVLCVINTLEPSGKSQRLFKMSSEEQEKVSDLFKSRIA